MVYNVCREISIMDKNKKILEKSRVKSAGDTVVAIDGEKFSVYGNFITGKVNVMAKEEECPTVEGGDCTISFNDQYVLISHKGKFFKKFLTIDEHERIFKNVSGSYWNKKSMLEKQSIAMLNEAVKIEKKSEEVLIGAQELSADIGLIIDKF